MVLKCKERSRECSGFPESTSVQGLSAAPYRHRSDKHRCDGMAQLGRISGNLIGSNSLCTAGHQFTVTTRTKEQIKPTWDGLVGRPWLCVCSSHPLLPRGDRVITERCSEGEDISYPMFLIWIIQMAPCETSSKTPKKLTHILSAVAEPERQPVLSPALGKGPCPHSWLGEVHGWKGQRLAAARVTKQRGAVPRLSPKCHEQRWPSMHAQFCCSVLPGPQHPRGAGSTPNIVLNTELKQQEGEKLGKSCVELQMRLIVYSRNSISGRKL